MNTTSHLRRAELHLERLAERARRRYQRVSAQPLGVLLAQYWSGLRVVEPAALEQLQQAWRSALPSSLAEHTHLEALRRGVLSVHVDSASHWQELDMHVRGGLAARLQGACPRYRISRIRLKLSSR